MTSLRVALFTLALIHVSVAQEPSLQLLPANILKALNDDVYVSCAAMVEDPELVTEMQWVGPNGQAIPNDDNTIITMEGIGGPGKLDLMINNLQDKDTGMYNCTATYAGNQKLTAGLTVDAFMDIDFGDTPTHQTPFIGTESKIRCTPTAKPAPQVDWLKDSTPLKNDDNHIIQQDGVLIKVVTEADEGIYRCRARVPQIGSIDYKDIQVEVYIPPAINIVPEDATGVEKETVTFKCGATGKPLPAYSWVNNENEPLEDKEGYFVDAEKGVLTIMELRPELAGTYRCTAKNPAGEETAEANLMVLTKPKVEQYLNLTNAVEEDAVMKCIATGSPLPDIIFKKESNEHSFLNGINVDDRIEVEQETDEEGRRVGIMKIRGVMRGDDGLYTCTAESEGGVTQVWGHITVEFKPSFEEQSKTEEWSWKQEPVNLTCLATAIPNATIQWYFRGEEIRATDENVQVLAYGPLGVLQVIPSQSYFGVYSCEATNRLGTTTHDLELKEAHVPGPVSAVQVEKKTATTITWEIIDPNDDGGLPIQSFVVEYCVRESGWDTKEMKIWTKGSSYTLDKLKPQSTYLFRFAAKNEAGNGEFGGDQVEEMPKRTAPEEPLIFNADSPVIENPYKDEYVLQWKVPLDNGEPIDDFDILYYQVHNSSGKWVNSGEKESENLKYPGATSFTIKNLNPDTYYKIELRAHNLIGYSTPAEVIIKTAHDPVGPQPSTGGVGTGLLVGIIVIVVIILVVVLDVVCYCTKNAGLTATIVGKRGPTDKDKEAMLEDGKNASDEKHEGNGQMKPAKEEEAKPVQPETDEKVKETTEPTETTPMIQGRTPDGTKSALNAYKAKMARQKPNVHSQSPSHRTGQTPRHVVDPRNNYKRSYSESYHLEDKDNTPFRVDNHLVQNSPRGTYEEIEYGPDGQPLSLRLALENPVFATNSNMKSSKSTPLLADDSDSSVDSTYDVPFQDEVLRRHSYMADTSPPPRPTKPKPPLPVRNPKTRLASSQEDLLSDHKNRLARSHLGSQDSLLDPSGMYEEVKDPPNSDVKVIDNRSRMKYVISSNEALDRLPRQVEDIKTNREIHSQHPLHVSKENLTAESTPRSTYKSPSQSSYSTFYQPVDSPFYLKQTKVAFGVAGYDDPMHAPQPSRGQHSPFISNKVTVAPNRTPLPQGGQHNEALDRLPRQVEDIKSSREMHSQHPLHVSKENLTAEFTPRSTYKSPSQSSCSTFYQPVDSPFYLKQTKVAFRMAGYDDPMHAPQPSRGQHSPVISNKVTEAPNRSPLPQGGQRMPLSPSSKPLSQKRPMMPQPKKPTGPPPPTPESKKSINADKGKNKPVKTVTTLYFVERPQHPHLSQSVDRLDDGQYSPLSTEESTSSFFPPSTLSSARSLGSLLSTDSSQRSYNQPTLI